MTTCSFRRCTNTSRNSSKSSGVTFHSFPQDPCFKEKWIKIIQFEQRDDDWLPTRFSRLCSKHFTEKDFYVTPLGRRKIKAGAMPSFPRSFVQKQNGRPGSPRSIVYLPSGDSTTDSPKETRLKTQLRIEKNLKDKCKREIINLKKQNNYLKVRNKTLQVLVKSLKKRIALLSRDSGTVLSNDMTIKNE